MKTFFALLSLLVAGMLLLASGPTHASGGSGGGGGGSTTPFSGNWNGAITTSFGTGAFNLKMSQSGTTLNGSAHFGAPIFDATLKLVAGTLNTSQFAGTVSSGEGSLPITGTLSPDGATITGTVTQGQVYTYVVTRQ